MLRPIEIGILDNSKTLAENLAGALTHFASASKIPIQFRTEPSGDGGRKNLTRNGLIEVLKNPPDIVYIGIPIENTKNANRISERIKERGRYIAETIMKKSPSTKIIRIQREHPPSNLDFLVGQKIQLPSDWQNKGCQDMFESSLRVSLSEEKISQNLDVLVVGLGDLGKEIVKNISEVPYVEKIYVLCKHLSKKSMGKFNGSKKDIATFEDLKEWVGSEGYSKLRFLEEDEDILKINPDAIYLARGEYGLDVTKYLTRANPNLRKRFLDYVLYGQVLEPPENFLFPDFKTPSLVDFFNIVKKMKIPPLLFVATNSSSDNSLIAKLCGINSYSIIFATPHGPRSKNIILRHVQEKYKGNLFFPKRVQDLTVQEISTYIIGPHGGEKMDLINSLAGDYELPLLFTCEELQILNDACSEELKENGDKLKRANKRIGTPSNRDTVKAFELALKDISHYKTYPNSTPLACYDEELGMYMAVPTTRIEYDGESKRRTVHSEVSLNSLKENLPEIYCHLIKQAEAQREFLLANLPKNLKRKYEQHLNRLAA